MRPPLLGASRRLPAAAVSRPRSGAVGRLLWRVGMAFAAVTWATTGTLNASPEPFRVGSLAGAYSIVPLAAEGQLSGKFIRGSHVPACSTAVPTEGGPIYFDCGPYLYRGRRAARTHIP